MEERLISVWIVNHSLLMDEKNWNRPKENTAKSNKHYNQILVQESPLPQIPLIIGQRVKQSADILNLKKKLK